MSGVIFFAFIVLGNYRAPYIFGLLFFISFWKLLVIKCWNIAFASFLTPFVLKLQGVLDIFYRSPKCFLNSILYTFFLFLSLVWCFLPTSIAVHYKLQFVEIIRSWNADLFLLNLLSVLVGSWVREITLIKPEIELMWSRI